MQYRVYTYDLITNSNGSKEVNDVRRSGTVIDFPADPSKEQLVKALKEHGEIRPKIRFSSFTCDGDFGYTLYLYYKGNPALELRPEPQMDLDDENYIG